MNLWDEDYYKWRASRRKIWITLENGARCTLRINCILKFSTRRESNNRKPVTIVCLGDGTEFVIIETPDELLAKVNEIGVKEVCGY